MQKITKAFKILTHWLTLHISKNCAWQHLIVTLSIQLGWKLNILMYQGSHFLDDPKFQVFSRLIPGYNGNFPDLTRNCITISGNWQVNEMTFFFLKINMNNSILTNPGFAFTIPGCSCFWAYSWLLPDLEE